MTSELLAIAYSRCASCSIGFRLLEWATSGLAGLQHSNQFPDLPPCRDPCSASSSVLVGRMLLTSGMPAASAVEASNAPSPNGGLLTPHARLFGRGVSPEDRMGLAHGVGVTLQNLVPHIGDGISLSGF